jgi:mono/diheme cytochrome c family protein
MRSDLYEPLGESGAASVAPSPVPRRLYPLYRKMRNPAPDNAQSVAKGRLLFGANCKVCHGAAGEGVGVGLEPAPRDLTSPALQAARSDGELFFVIQNGILDTAMLPWGGRLSDRDIWMVVRYLRFLPSQ